jgi:hypothetical protein
VIARPRRQFLAVIGAELKDFLESGVRIYVGACNEALIPSMSQAWGPRVSDDGASVELFVDRPAGDQAIASLQANGRIAATFTFPPTFRTIQLKGGCLDIGDPAAEGWSRIERHRSGFAQVVAYYGYPAHIVRNLWSMHVARVRFTVEDIYNQTPGPGAGEKL